MKYHLRMAYLKFLRASVHCVDLLVQHLHFFIASKPFSKQLNSLSSFLGVFGVIIVIKSMKSVYLHSQFYRKYQTHQSSIIIKN